MKIFFLIFLNTLSNSFSKESNKIKVENMYLAIKSNFSEVPEIKLSEIDKLIQENGIQFVDVREEKERSISIIPNAISKEEFEGHIDKYKSKKIVVYCTIGYRSASYAKKLKKMGIKAYNLEGSILGWVHDGRQVVSEDGKVSKRVHVYGPPWNYPPTGLTGEW
jgi:rhodanese-related sulfurtransferase